MGSITGIDTTSYSPQERSAAVSEFAINFNHFWSKQPLSISTLALPKSITLITRYAQEYNLDLIVVKELYKDALAAGLLEGFPDLSEG